MRGVGWRAFGVHAARDTQCPAPHLGVQGHLWWPLFLSPSLGQTLWREG